MGQKVNPNSLRFGLNKNWVSRWNAPNRKIGARWLIEDEKIRALIKLHWRKCGVGHIEIERFVNLDESVTVKINLYLSQLGLFISQEKENTIFNKKLRRILGKGVKFKIDPRNLENPAVCAELVGQEIVDAFQSRSHHRIIIKRILKRTMGSGALGIKIKVSGRINGVEIARSEAYSEGSVPSSTLRADIDYSFQTAKTSYGILGVKVWINRGLYFGKHFMPISPANLKPSTWKSRDNKENKFIANSY